MAARSPSDPLGVELVHVDLHLRPLAGAALRLDKGLFAWAFAPDRATLALGVAPAVYGPGDPGASLRLVDTETLGLVHEISLGGGTPWSVSWPAPDRILVMLGHCCPAGTRPAELVVVEPSTQRVLARVQLPFTEPLAVRHGDGSLLILSTSAAGIGPAQLTLVDSQGSLRTTTLTPIEAGRPVTAGVQEMVPALALGDGHAYVISPRLVADVDLDSFEVSYHSIALGGKTAQSGAGAVLWGQALKNGMLAVSGWTESSGTALNPGLGLSLIDPSTWQIRTLDRKADSFTAAGNLLLATVSNALFGDVASSKGPALRVYRVGGKRLFQLFRRQSVEVAEVYEGRAYVYWFAEHGNSTAPAPIRIVDLHRGRIIGRRAWGAFPVILSDDPASPPFTISWVETSAGGRLRGAALLGGEAPFALLRPL